ncbi:hypothetical protein [Nesterenkonia muleiensis]|uniref:hypothetical protein n=1 Tax=Nesterenkonia muleiensis TaxID=2282648 RepID=UPI000E76B2D2|nr:hypothetical protein [Nesterenkonia muleiensis]
MTDKPSSATSKLLNACLRILATVVVIVLAIELIKAYWTWIALTGVIVAVATLPIWWRRARSTW